MATIKRTAYGEYGSILPTTMDWCEWRDLHAPGATHWTKSESLTTAAMTWAVARLAAAAGWDGGYLQLGQQMYGRGFALNRHCAGESAHYSPTPFTTFVGWTRAEASRYLCGALATLYL